MKTKHAVHLMQTGYTTIAVRINDGLQLMDSFKEANPNKPVNQPSWMAAKPAPQQSHTATPPPVHPSSLHTYKVGLDEVAVGDTVVVPVHNASSVALGVVEEVHEAPQIDVDAHYDYTWIIGKVGYEQFYQRKTAEAEFTKGLQALELKNRQEEMQRQLMESMGVNPDSATEQFNSAIAAMNNGINAPVGITHAADETAASGQ